MLPLTALQAFLCTCSSQFILPEDKLPSRTEYNISDKVSTGSHMMARTLSLSLLKLPLAMHPTVTLVSCWQLLSFCDQLTIPHPLNAPIVAIYLPISSLLLAEVSIGTLQMQSLNGNFWLTELNTIFPFKGIQFFPDNHQILICTDTLLQPYCQQKASVLYLLLWQNFKWNY